MARLNDTEAIASRPIVETANPDVSGFRARAPYGLGREMAGPHAASPDNGKPLRGAVSYLNGTACKPEC